jgi:2,5-diketo-D-gluconate reductase A
LRQSKLPREQFWVTVVLWTKGRNHQGLLDAYEALLYELGLDAADCAVLHACLNPSKFLDQWAALEQLKKNGRVRSIGVGRCSLPNLEDLLKQSQIMPATYVDEISPFARDEQALHYLVDNNVTLVTTNFARGLDDPPQSMISQIAAEVSCSSWEVCLQWARQKQMLVSIGNLPRHQIETAVQQLQTPRFTLSAEQIAQLDALNERFESSDER